MERWALNLNSLWVLADPSTIKTHNGIPTLVSSKIVMRIATTQGVGVPLFSDDDLARRYVSAGKFQEYEPARLANAASFLRFLNDLAAGQVACFVVDATFADGDTHARLLPLHRAREATEELLRNQADSRP